MGLRTFWQNYKVLLVMLPSLGLIHWGWYSMKQIPQLRQTKEEYIPEPGIVAHVSRKGVGMKPRSWLRRNWLWAAGGAFVSIHLATWLMQTAMKGAVRSEAAALKERPAEGRAD